jgi:hypothetical protein
MATTFLDYKIPIGLFKKTTKYIQAHVSARMWFREILKWLNVPYYDCSCPTDSIGLPIKYDKTTSKLQYLDDVTKTWTNVPNSALNPA